jgi:hypothetical protein
MSDNCSFLCGKDPDCKTEISCFKKIAGTLTGDEILGHKIVLTEQETEITKNDKSFKATTFDLTVGDGHYLYDGLSDDKNKWSLIYIGDVNEDDLNKNYPIAERYKRPDGTRSRTLTIPRFGSALIQLQQIINTYDIAYEKNILIVGRFDLKLSRVHEGLISQQATQVEPCYYGKLFCFIHNLSNEPVYLEYGHRIATIEFSYVSCFCNDEHRKDIINNIIKTNEEKYIGKHCYEGKGIKDIRYFYHKQKLPNDCGLLSFKNNFKEIMFSDTTLEDLAKRVKNIMFLEDAITDLTNRVEKRIDRKAKWIPLFVAIIPAIATIIVACINIIPKINDIDRKHSEIKTMYDKINEKYNELSNNIIIKNDNEENKP